MEKQFKFYFNDEFIDYGLLGVIKIIKEFDSFKIFCAFVNPRTVLV